MLLGEMLMTNVSDHLSVFIHENQYCTIVQDSTVIFIRNTSAEALNALREDLKKQRWDEVY